MQPGSPRVADAVAAQGARVQEGGLGGGVGATAVAGRPHTGLRQLGGGGQLAQPVTWPPAQHPPATACACQWLVGGGAGAPSRLPPWQCFLTATKHAIHIFVDAYCDMYLQREAGELENSETEDEHWAMGWMCCDGVWPSSRRRRTVESRPKTTRWRRLGPRPPPPMGAPSTARPPPAASGAKRPPRLLRGLVARGRPSVRRPRSWALCGPPPRECRARRRPPSTVAAPPQRSPR
jgi:hypothetical protein